MRASGGVAAVLGLFGLGCSGMMGYGKEVASTPVNNASAFTVSYTPATDKPHQLWLDYDLTLNGDWLVTGDVDVAAAGTSIAHGSLDFKKEGSPMSSSRVTLNSVESEMNGNGSARGTIWLKELPSQPAGTKVDVTGTFTAGPQTAVNSMRLVVTE